MGTLIEVARVVALGETVFSKADDIDSLIDNVNDVFVRKTGKKATADQLDEISKSLTIIRY